MVAFVKDESGSQFGIEVWFIGDGGTAEVWAADGRVQTGAKECLEGWLGRPSGAAMFIRDC